MTISIFLTFLGPWARDPPQGRSYWVLKFGINFILSYKKLLEDIWSDILSYFINGNLFFLSLLNYPNCRPDFWVIPIFPDLWSLCTAVVFFLMLTCMHSHCRRPNITHYMSVLCTAPSSCLFTSLIQLLLVLESWSGFICGNHWALNLRNGAGTTSTSTRGNCDYSNTRCKAGN